uniref:NADH-ubiquinone oxidoreductase chain 3 n=1 Tax=Cavernulicola chilensis TaxID=3028028 RepID=A0A7H0WB91_9RHOD|nr:NADH dehydrogenase subunit 3 [Cavernulicola chilensis]QNR39820.1 NADH dehydrogenase subunit 3 [Cavernulicola chilensis]
MKILFPEYGVILTYFLLATLLSCVVFALSYVISVQKADPEKISAYECGFNPFDDARTTFDVRFYLVAMLFLVFDLEVSFLFPWCLVLGNIPYAGFWSMVLFLVILTVGFVYEWCKGALEWE